MLVSLLKKPDEIGSGDIEIEFSKPRYTKVVKAEIVWPKGHPPKSLERLCEAPWTRSHAYGYVLDAHGELWKIDELEFNETSTRVTAVFLIPVSRPKKIEAYCKCGGAIAGSVMSKNRASVEKCVEVFWSVHTKPGCGPTDAKTAGKARRKAEKKAASE